MAQYGSHSFILEDEKRAASAVILIEITDIRIK